MSYADNDAVYYEVICARVHEQQVCASVNSVQVYKYGRVQVCRSARVQVCMNCKCEHCALCACVISAQECMSSVPKE